MSVENASKVNRTLIEITVTTAEGVLNTINALFKLLDEQRQNRIREKFFGGKEGLAVAGVSMDDMRDMLKDMFPDKNGKSQFKLIALDNTEEVLVTSKDKDVYDRIKDKLTPETIREYLDKKAGKEKSLLDIDDIPDNGTTEEFSSEDINKVIETEYAEQINEKGEGERSLDANEDFTSEIGKEKDTATGREPVGTDAGIIAGSDIPDVEENNTAEKVSENAQKTERTTMQETEHADESVIREPDLEAESLVDHNNDYRSDTASMADNAERQEGISQPAQKDIASRDIYEQFDDTEKDTYRQPENTDKDTYRQSEDTGRDIYGQFEDADKDTVSAAPEDTRSSAADDISRETESAYDRNNDYSSDYADRDTPNVSQETPAQSTLSVESYESAVEETLRRENEVSQAVNDYDRVKNEYDRAVNDYGVAMDEQAKARDEYRHLTEEKEIREQNKALQSERDDLERKLSTQSDTVDYYTQRINESTSRSERELLERELNSAKISYNETKVQSESIEKQINENREKSSDSSERSNADFERDYENAQNRLKETTEHLNSAREQRTSSFNELKSSYEQVAVSKNEYENAKSNAARIEDTLIRSGGYDHDARVQDLRTNLSKSESNISAEMNSRSQSMAVVHTQILNSCSDPARVYEAGRVGSMIGAGGSKDFTGTVPGKNTSSSSGSNIYNTQSVIRCTATSVSNVRIHTGYEVAHQIRNAASSVTSAEVSTLKSMGLPESQDFENLKTARNVVKDVFFSTSGNNTRISQIYGKSQSNGFSNYVNGFITGTSTSIQQFRSGVYQFAEGICAKKAGIKTGSQSLNEFVQRNALKDRCSSIDTQVKLGKMDKAEGDRMKRVAFEKTQKNVSDRDIRKFITTKYGTKGFKEFGADLGSLFKGADVRKLLKGGMITLSPDQLKAYNKLCKKLGLDPANKAENMRILFAIKNRMAGSRLKDFGKGLGKLTLHAWKGFLKGSGIDKAFSGITKTWTWVKNTYKTVRMIAVGGVKLVGFGVRVIGGKRLKAWKEKRQKAKELKEAFKKRKKIAKAKRRKRKFKKLYNKTLGKTKAAKFVTKIGNKVNSKIKKVTRRASRKLTTFGNKVFNPFRKFFHIVGKNPVAKIIGKVFAAPFKVLQALGTALKTLSALFAKIKLYIFAACAAILLLVFGCMTLFIFWDNITSKVTGLFASADEATYDIDDIDEAAFDESTIIGCTYVMLKMAEAQWVNGLQTCYAVTSNDTDNIFTTNTSSQYYTLYGEDRVPIDVYVNGDGTSAHPGISGWTYCQDSGNKGHIEISDFSYLGANYTFLNDLAASGEIELKQFTNIDGGVNFRAAGVGGSPYASNIKEIVCMTQVYLSPNGDELEIDEDNEDEVDTDDESDDEPGFWKNAGKWLWDHNTWHMMAEAFAVANKNAATLSTIKNYSLKLFEASHDQMIELTLHTLPTPITAYRESLNLDTNATTYKRASDTFYSLICPDYADGGCMQIDNLSFRKVELAENSGLGYEIGYVTADGTFHDLSKIITPVNETDNIFTDSTGNNYTDILSSAESADGGESAIIDSSDTLETLKSVTVLNTDTVNEIICFANASTTPENLYTKIYSNQDCWTAASAYGDETGTDTITYNNGSYTNLPTEQWSETNNFTLGTDTTDWGTLTIQHKLFAIYSSSLGLSSEITNSKVIDVSDITIDSDGNAYYTLTLREWDPSGHVEQGTYNKIVNVHTCSQDDVVVAEHQYLADIYGNFKTDSRGNKLEVTGQETTVIRGVSTIFYIAADGTRSRYVRTEAEYDHSRTHQETVPVQVYRPKYIERKVTIFLNWACAGNHSGRFCAGHLCANVTGLVVGWPTNTYTNGSWSYDSYDDADREPIYPVSKLTVIDIDGDGDSSTNPILDNAFVIDSREGKTTCPDPDHPNDPINLFMLDSVFRHKLQSDEWEGWTDDNIDRVINMYNDDWEEEYGYDIRHEPGASKTLTSERKENIVNAIISAYNLDSSDEVDAMRIKIVSLALDTVGNGMYDQNHHSCVYGLPCVCGGVIESRGVTVDGVRYDLSSTTSVYNNSGTESVPCYTTDCSGYAGSIYTRCGDLLGYADPDESSGESELGIIACNATMMKVIDHGDGTVSFSQPFCPVSTFSTATAKPGDLCIFKNSHVMIYMGTYIDEGDTANGSTPTEKIWFVHMSNFGKGTSTYADVGNIYYSSYSTDYLNSKGALCWSLEETMQCQGYYYYKNGLSAVSDYMQILYDGN